MGQGDFRRAGEFRLHQPTPYQKWYDAVTGRNGRRATSMVSGCNFFPLRCGFSLSPVLPADLKVEEW